MRRRVSWQGVLASVLTLLASRLPVVLQAQTDAQTPVFRLQVRRVPVDVVVLDKAGNPVRGLTKDDFIVKEDHKEERVLSFDSFDGSKPDFVPPHAPPLPANTFLNLPAAPERGPLYILYYDMVNTPPADQEVFRKELLRFIDHAQPGTRMALFVNTRRLQLLQGFTSDHALLREAIVRKGPGPHVPDVFIYGENFGMSDVGGCLSNMKFISEYMSGIPGRKNLIWLASIFPIPVSPTLSGPGQALAGQGPQSFSVGAGGGPQVLDLTELERENIERTYAAMMKSQIALYPVDVRGVLGSGEDPHEAANAMVDHQNMDTIASATGGRAYYGSNHESDLMDRVIDHGESYYTLSYEPSNTKFDGTERHIEVTLAKKGDYRLTYRKVYYAVPDEGAQDKHKKDELQARFLAAKAQDTLWANIEHGAPMLHDLLFTAHLATEGAPHMATPEEMDSLQDAPDYFITRKKKKSAQKPPAPIKLQKYVIDYGVMDPQLRATAARHDKTATLEFAVAAYNDEGRLLNSMLNQGVPPENSGKPVFHAVQELEVPPGAAFIRLAVRDTLTNRTGTLEVTLPLKDAPGKQAMGALPDAEKK